MKQTQGFFILLGIVLLGFFVFLPMSRPWSISNYPGYTMMNMMGGYGSMFFGMSFLLILVIVFLILGILWFSQELFHKGRR